jgi:hypothetical protein
VAQAPLPILCLFANFKKTSKAWKNKSSKIIKAYKDDKLTNSISGDARHTYKFYDAMDTSYH